MAISKVPAALLAAALFLTPALSMAEVSGPPERTILTQGHGEVKVRPDSLGVSLMVEATHAELAKARAENSRKMQAIITALKSLNIPNMKLETQNLQVFPMQGEYVKNQLPKTLGYRVTNGLSVTVTKLSPDELGEAGSRIMDAALKSGANHLHGMNFYLSDLSEPRLKALEAAVKDAQRNAHAMAQAAGVSVSGVHSMEGTPQYHHNYANEMRMRRMEMSHAAQAGGVANSDIPVEPGEATVTSDVTVRFRF